MISNWQRISRWLVGGAIVVGIAAPVGSNADATTLLGSDFQISFDSGAETSPDVLLATKSSTGSFLSVWDERSAATIGDEVFGQLFSQAGQLVGSKISIAPLANGSSDTRPRLGYSPLVNTFTAVWTDGRNATTTNDDIYGQLIASNGSLIGSNFPISTAYQKQQRPGIAYNSVKDQFLVVWQDARNNPQYTDVYGQILSSNGKLVGANFPISTATNFQDRARVAFDPIMDQYLVIWSDQRNQSVSGYDIYAQRVGPGGALIGAAIVVANAAGDQFRPDITWDNNDQEFMAVWVDCRNILAPSCVSGEKANGDIYGQVIASGGALVGSNFAVATSSDSEYRPAISFAPASGLFQVIYSDQPQSLAASGGSFIYGEEVAPNGTLVGQNGPVTPINGFQERAGLSYNPNNNEFIVAFVNQASANAVQNVWGQFLAP